MRRFRAKVRPRPKTPGRMNGLETEYAAHLALRGLFYRFESIPLRLANRTTYTADFVVYDTEGCLEFHEVKGFWRDDARVKIKVAAEMYPEFAFFAVTWDRKAKLWVYEPFGEAAKEIM